MAGESIGRWRQRLWGVRPADGRGHPPDVGRACFGGWTTSGTHCRGSRRPRWANRRGLGRGDLSARRAMRSPTSRPYCRVARRQGQRDGMFGALGPPPWRSAAGDAGAPKIGTSARPQPGTDVGTSSGRRGPDLPGAENLLHQGKLRAVPLGPALRQAFLRAAKALYQKNPVARPPVAAPTTHSAPSPTAKAMMEGIRQKADAISPPAATGWSTSQRSNRLLGGCCACCQLRLSRNCFQPWPTIDIVPDRRWQTTAGSGGRCRRPSLFDDTREPVATCLPGTPLCQGSPGSARWRP